MTLGREATVEYVEYLELREMVGKGDRLKCSLFPTPVVGK